MTLSSVKLVIFTAWLTILIIILGRLTYLVHKDRINTPPAVAQFYKGAFAPVQEPNGDMLVYGFRPDSNIETITQLRWNGHDWVKLSSLKLVK